MSQQKSPIRAWASAGALSLALLAAPTMVLPSNALPAGTQAPVATVSGPRTSADGTVDLPIAPRAQEQTNWCWAATGSTIAEYKGKKVTQNVFCNLAFRRATTSSCPNSQATLADDQTAFKALGIKPGNYISGYLNFDAIADEISKDRPILTRIQWSSGGGHMMVINGYNAQDETIEWYNPWPDSDRINVGDYNYYVDGSDFSWTHTLYGIGAV